MDQDPPGLDLGRLRPFLDRHVGGVGSHLTAELIPGGKSNLTYVLCDGDADRRWVLRRPPLAHVLPTAHDMSREWRVISALQDTGIPVPPAIAECTDPDVIGAPFYIMGFVDGHVVREKLPRDWPRTASTRQEMSAALVETLLALHAVDPEEVGLGTFGHPEGFLERQVRRWWQQWEASKTRALPSIEELHERLQKSVPEQGTPGIVHGDYRFDNVIFNRTDPSRIDAIVDWEMSTIGDPLCDLGLLLVYWVDDPSDPTAEALPGTRLTLDDGFFSRVTLVHEYASGSKRNLQNLEWYVALGAFKLAIIAEGIHARFLMGMTVGEGFDQMGEMVPVIVEHALERARRSNIARLRGSG